MISHWVLCIATPVTGPGQLCAEGSADVFGTEGHICVSAREKNLTYFKIKIQFSSQKPAKGIVHPKFCHHLLTLILFRFVWQKKIF